MIETKLDSEEKLILEAYREDQLESVPLSREELEGYRAAARAVRRKGKHVSTRVSAQG